MRAEEAIAGKTVALVGNSSAGLERRLGMDIDAHRVVIRMNAGVPDKAKYRAIGRRTDILAVGTAQCLTESARHLRKTVPIWFWKATKLGDKQFVSLIQEEWMRLWRVPKEWIGEAAEAVDGKPSGGIGLVHSIVKHMAPASLSVFNFDFFGALGSKDSWWHTERPEAVIQRKHPHDGEKELAYFKSLGFEQVQEGWWYNRTRR